MNSKNELLRYYNENRYLIVLKYLCGELDKVEAYLNSIVNNQKYNVIYELEQLYNDIFLHDLVADDMSYKVSKIEHSLSFWRTEKKLNRSNSYYHLKLILNSDIIKELDNIYGTVLSKILRFYKHLFSKIDNLYVTFKADQVNAFLSVLDGVKSDVQKFLEYSQHREIIAQRLKLDEQKLNNLPYKGLFYITHIDNIESILKFGILSHNLAHKEGLVKVDISNAAVNARRNKYVNVLEGNIHDYSPLYINHKNPMLFTLCKNNDKKTLVLLRVNPHILLTEGVVFSDGNAASNSTRFYNNISDFNKLNWNLIKKGFWYNYEFGIEEGRRIMCSEVLVKNKIPLYMINDIFIYDENVLDRILPLFPNHIGTKVFINRNLYF